MGHVHVLTPHDECNIHALQTLHYMLYIIWIYVTKIFFKKPSVSVYTNK